MHCTKEKFVCYVNDKKDKLDLYWNRFVEKDTPLLVEFLNENPKIRTLDIGGNKIGAESTQIIAANSTLTSLNFTSNQIGFEGIKAFSTNTTLKTLDLSWNDIDDAGVKALLVNTTLRTLSLTGCGFGIHSAQALALNTTLTSLDVGFNKLGDDGIRALAMNTTLTELYVGYNKFGSDGAKALAMNTTLKTLFVGENVIGAEGARALVMNTTLTSLDIRGNEFSDDDACQLTQALNKNHTLIILRHDFAKKHSDRVARLLARNQVTPWLRTVCHARLMSQAQRTLDCPLGFLPVELLALINDYAVGANHFNFFVRQHAKRPSEQDLENAKRMANAQENQSGQLEVKK